MHRQNSSPQYRPRLLDRSSPQYNKSSQHTVRTVSIPAQCAGSDLPDSARSTTVQGTDSSSPRPTVQQVRPAHNMQRQHSSPLYRPRLARSSPQYNRSGQHTVCTVSGVARIVCQGGGHRFGVVKRPKIINVCRTTPGSTVYSCVCVIALGLCVIHIQ